MKTDFAHLRGGQQVWAVVEESLAKSELLVNFSGDLIRIANETEKTFRAGERICLRVEAISPLRFKLISPRSQARQRPGPLDVSV